MGLYMLCHACGTEGKICRFPLSIIYILVLEHKSSVVGRQLYHISHLNGPKLPYIEDMQEKMNV